MREFNKDSLANTGYEDYLGHLPQRRKYLNRTFLETMWLTGSPGHLTITTEGLTLSDKKTYIKGFSSFLGDSHITRLSLERLPFLPTKLLEQDMQARLAAFGKVLDLGITLYRGDYMGQGYATLDTTPTKDQLVPFEKLTRVIDWTTDDGDVRHVLLQWEDMPDFCRICQKYGHCRADCPDYQKYLKCHNCNKTGHIMRNCPRHNSPKSDLAPSKKKRM